VSELASGEPGGGATGRHAAAFRLADGLALAASPTFAIMSLLTAVFGEGPMDMLCSGSQAFPIGGMVPMYGLMAAFHSGHWLELISGQNVSARRS
jgi:hypothetical protein